MDKTTSRKVNTPILASEGRPKVILSYVRRSKVDTPILAFERCPKGILSNVQRSKFILSFDHILLPVTLTTITIF